MRICCWRRRSSSVPVAAAPRRLSASWTRASSERTDASVGARSFASRRSRSAPSLSLFAIRARAARELLRDDVLRLLALDRVATGRLGEQSLRLVCAGARGHRAARPIGAGVGTGSACRPPGAGSSARARHEDRVLYGDAAGVDPWDAASARSRVAADVGPSAAAGRPPRRPPRPRTPNPTCAKSAPWTLSPVRRAGPAGPSWSTMTDGDRERRSEPARRIQPPEGGEIRRTNPRPETLQPDPRPTRLRTLPDPDLAKPKSAEPKSAEPKSAEPKSAEPRPANLEPGNRSAPRNEVRNARPSDLDDDRARALHGRCPTRAAVSNPSAVTSVSSPAARTGESIPDTVPCRKGKATMRGSPGVGGAVRRRRAPPLEGAAATVVTGMAPGPKSRARGS